MNKAMSSIFFKSAPCASSSSLEDELVFSLVCACFGYLD